ncbi:Arm DNA-binding domain-containing protein, partial [Klebsiella michiganensis]|jgi:hypothetical protein
VNIMPLSDTAIRNADIRSKNYSLTDMDGLSLFVSKTGTKSWHFRYYQNGKQNRLSFGSYPEISLSEARVLRHPLVLQPLGPAKHLRRSDCEYPCGRDVSGVTRILAGGADAGGRQDRRGSNRLYQWWNSRN